MKNVITFEPMRIGINTRFLLQSKMEGFGWYTYEVVRRMVANHPEHEFYFFFDRPFDSTFVFAHNVTPIVLFPPARHPILFKWWFNYSITKALKKYKIDVFYSPDGYCSLRTKVPQIGVIHDINFEHFPSDIPKTARRYLQKYFPLFAAKADHILTVSSYSKMDICKTYHVPESKVTVAWNGASEDFKPLTQDVIAQVRATYSRGRPYFIFVGALHPRKNVGRLIQAFEQFAEKNHSIDLLIVGENLWESTSMRQNKPQTTIAERIYFTGHVSQNVLTQLMGAAFALSYVPYFEGFGIPLVEAMNCGVPIISGNLTSLPEVVGDAAILIDPYSVSDISKAMTQLAEDPSYYQHLAQKSISRSRLFSWQHTADVTWNTIEQIYLKKFPSKQ